MCILMGDLLDWRGHLSGEGCSTGTVEDSIDFVMVKCGEVKEMAGAEESGGDDMGLPCKESFGLFRGDDEMGERCDCGDLGLDPPSESKPEVVTRGLPEREGTNLSCWMMVGVEDEKIG
jgi:hypothetical protein